MSANRTTPEPGPQMFIYPFAIVIMMGFLVLLTQSNRPQTSGIKVAVEPTGTSAPVIVPTATATLLSPSPTVKPTERPTNTPQAVAAVSYDPALVAKGKQGFVLCSACHGPDAKGLPNLGKNLLESTFVKSQTDDQLLAFIKKGRPSFDPANTTGIDMPPKGGNPALKDDEIKAIIIYIRSITPGGGPAPSAASGTAPTATPIKPTPTKVVFKPLPTKTPATVNMKDPAIIAKGKQGFILCSACHGPDAKGLPNLGKNLVESEFVRTQTDDQLLAFIKKGRPSFDPANTTKIDMPPKGGNPALKDEEIMAIIAYLRSIEVKK